MNIILLRRDDWISDDLVVLRDRRADHIRHQLHADVGDPVRVGLRDGPCGDAIVCAMDSDGVSLCVQLSESPPPRHRFDIVLALPRPKMLRRILRTVAEFGVQNLHLIHSARVEKSYWQSPLLHAERLDEALLAGLERSRDTCAPKVHLHRRFRPFVEDQLPALCAGRPCWIADPAGRQSLAEVAAEAALVMIGPEGDAGASRRAHPQRGYRPDHGARPGAAGRPWPVLNTGADGQLEAEV
mgnify:CR=1 FL=1